MNQTKKVIRRVPGRRVRVLLGAEHTDGQLAVIQSIVTREQEPPLHAHREAGEVVVVMDGDVEFIVNGKRQRCRRGATAYVPAGSEHAFVVRSRRATLLTIVMPAGLEAYYTELDAPVEPAQAIERLIAVSARFGVDIMGPSLREALEPIGE